MTKKIAFVSCAFAAERGKNQPAWTQIRAADPDLLLLLGDTAYMSWGGDPHNPKDWLYDDLETCYQKQFEVEDFAWLMKNKPTLAIWDDHDCGPNNVCGAEHPERVLRTRAMFDRWMRRALNVGGQHMYFSYDGVPGVRILMLDGRTHRRPPGSASSTALGKDQEDWLLRQLDRPNSEQPRITIVACGVGLSEGSAVEVLDAYPTFAKELRRRLAFRAGDADDAGRRSLFIAGDIHRNVFKPQPKRVYEVLSSGVACFRPKTYVKADFVTENFADNWGLMTVGDKQIELQFHGHAENAFSKTIDIATWKVVSSKP